MIRALGSLLCGAVVSAAAAQSATISISGPSTAAPGEMVTITVECDYDTAAGGDGLFGAEGFYGAGFSLTTSGDAVATASDTVLNTDLSQLVAAGEMVGSNVNAIGGARGMLAAVTTDPITLLTYKLTIDENATAGQTITVTFSGSVILDVAADLDVYTTESNPGQGPLNPASLTITVVDDACPADLDPPGGDGALGFFDLVAYLTLFAAMDPAADLDPVGGDGAFGFFDLVAYLTLFAAGCP